MFQMPFIAADNYEAIVSIMRPHLARTYDEWLDLRAKWRAEYGANGVIDVNVNPHQFATFVSNSGRAPDLQALLTFCEGGRE